MSALRQAALWTARLGCVGYGIVLVLVLASHATGRWPFILFASFTPMLAVLAVPVFVVSLVALKRWSLVLIALGIAAFWPFATYDDFAEPTDAACDDGACTTIVMANLRQDLRALNALPAVSGEADVIVLVELPIEATEASLLEQYPMGGLAELSLLIGFERYYGSRMAVISRGGGKATFIDQPQHPYRLRRIARLDRIGTGGELRLVGVHPSWPRSRHETQLRNSYLRRAAAELSATNNFVLIGDFNMTPWEPTFAKLPGRRAGNPRWTRTWNARGLERLTIDHALVGEGLEVVSAQTLPDIGSDHHPIRVTVRPREHGSDRHP